MQSTNVNKETPHKLRLDLGGVLSSSQSHRTSPSIHRGFTGRIPLPFPPDEHLLPRRPSDSLEVQGRPHSARVPKQTVELKLAVEGKNAHRPQTARLFQPHPAVGNMTTRHYEGVSDEHKKIETHSPQPPAHRPERPQTARTVRDRRVVNSPNQPRARPQTARASQTMGAQDIQRPQDATGVIVPRRRQHFSARPLSGVPVIQPNGVQSDLLKSLAPNHYELSQATRQATAKKASERNADVAFHKLKQAILRGEPLPTQEQPTREPSPVRWNVIEQETPLAACERNILRKQKQPQRGRDKGQATPPHGHKAQVRPPAHRGKFLHFGRPKNQLRPQVDEHQVASAAAAEGRTLLRDDPSNGERRTNAEAEPGVDTSAMESMVERLQEPDCRLFLAHTDVQAVSARQQEPVTRLKPTMYDYLAPEHLAKVVDRLPLACDGRVQVSAELKQVIAKREALLLERVHDIVQTKQHKETLANTGHVLRKNVRESTVEPAAKRSRAAAASLARVARGEEVRQRREAEEAKSREAALAKLQLREMAAKRLEAEEGRRAYEGHVKMALVVMAVGSSMAELAARMQLWRQQKVVLAHRRKAVKLISTCWKNYLLKKFRKARAEAVIRLSVWMRSAVKRWRRRYLDRRADIVVDLLRNVGSAARFQMAVRQFQLKVRKAQQFVRRHLGISRARMVLLELQWNRVDEERVMRFNERRAAMVLSIRTQMGPTLERKGAARAQELRRMKLIEWYGGAKKLRECRQELEESRRTYCEYFLPPEMRQVPVISAAVKRRMLRHYVKKFRSKYTQDWEAYARQRDLWAQLNQTKAELHGDLLAPPRRLASSAPTPTAPPTGTAAPISSAASELAHLAPGAPPPKPPNALIVLPPHVMAQIVAKAVETTKELSRKVLQGMAPGARQV